MIDRRREKFALDALHDLSVYFAVCEKNVRP